MPSSIISTFFQTFGDANLVEVVLVKLYLFRVTHFSNTILVSHETLRIIYNIFTMKEYFMYIYKYITVHLKKIMSQMLKHECMNIVNQNQDQKNQSIIRLKEISENLAS